MISSENGGYPSVVPEHPSPPEAIVPPPHIACLGVASWDRLLCVARFPVPGEQVMVEEEASAPGGSTTNTAVALARLGAEVSIAAAVGDDAPGMSIRAVLRREGVKSAWLLVHSGASTNAATIVVSSEPIDRTMFWRQGAQLRLGDRLPIEDIFGHDVVVLDLPDVPLRRFLLDLPAHTLPRTRLLGTLTHLAQANVPDALELAGRHDVIVGNEQDAFTVTGTSTIADATTALQHRMIGQALRAAIITRAELGCRIVTEGQTWQLPATPSTVVDPTGAGDAFAAGVAYGMAGRWAWPEVGRFANAMGALAGRSIGAQVALPSFHDARALLLYHRQS